MPVWAASHVRKNLRKEGICYKLISMCVPLENVYLSFKNSIYVTISEWNIQFIMLQGSWDTAWIKTACIWQQYHIIKKKTNIIIYVYCLLLITLPLYSIRITLRFSGVLYWVSRYLPRVKICLRSGSRQTLWQERALGPPWHKLKHVLESEIRNRHKAYLYSSNAHLLQQNGEKKKSLLFRSTVM